MFCEKCGAEIAEDSKFCAKCGKKTSLGLAEAKVQAYSSNQASEHVLARAEKSWAPLVSAIIWSALFLALYFMFEAWWIEPKFREIAVSAAKQSDMFCLKFNPPLGGGLIIFMKLLNNFGSIRICLLLFINFLFLRFRSVDSFLGEFRPLRRETRGLCPLVSCHPL